jgi:hypothetical protein
MHLLCLHDIAERVEHCFGRHGDFGFLNRGTEGACWTSKCVSVGKTDNALS